MVLSILFFSPSRIKYHWRFCQRYPWHFCQWYHFLESFSPRIKYYWRFCQWYHFLESFFVNDIIDGDEIIADLSVKDGPEVDLKVGPQVLKLEDMSKNYNDIEVEFTSLDFDELDEIEEKNITGLDSL